MSCGSIVLADRHPSMLMGIRSLLATEAEVVLMVTDEFSLIEAVQKVIPRPGDCGPIVSGFRRNQRREAYQTVQPRHQNYHIKHV